MQSINEKGFENISKESIKTLDDKKTAINSISYLIAVQDNNILNNNRQGNYRKNFLKNKLLNLNRFINIHHNRTTFFLIILLFLVLIIGIVFLILFALIPCIFASCNLKVSKCINRPFHPECVCNFGYNGPKCDG